MYMYVCKGVLLVMVGINWDLFSFFLSSSFLPSFLPSFLSFLSSLASMLFKILCHENHLYKHYKWKERRKKKKRKQTNIILHLHVKKQTNKHITHTCKQTNILHIHVHTHVQYILHPVFLLPPQTSREQLAVGGFAQALLVIPKTLAVNAALDSTDLVAKLRAFHNASQTMAERESLKW